MPFLEVKEVVKIYRGPGYTVQALKGVSFTVDRGEAVSVMGPSGSGKTTLLNIIGGVDKPSAGTVIVDGVDIVALSERSLREYRLHKVGYIFQFFNLIPTLTVLENLMLPMIYAGRRKEEALRRAEELLRAVGLEKATDRLPEELSGGERQRVAVALALVNDPPLILADEPTGELDIANAEKVVKLLVGLAHEENKTVLIATHDPRVARMTDRIILLRDGKIVGIYEPESLGGEAIEEVSRERLIVEYLKRRIQRLEGELAALADKLKRGELSPEEYARRYNELRSRIKALRDELAVLGAGVEAEG